MFAAALRMSGPIQAIEREVRSEPILSHDVEASPIDSLRQHQEVLSRYMIGWLVRQEQILETMCKSPRDFVPSEAVVNSIPISPISPDRCDSRGATVAESSSASNQIQQMPLETSVGLSKLPLGQIEVAMSKSCNLSQNESQTPEMTSDAKIPENQAKLKEPAEDAVGNTASYVGDMFTSTDSMARYRDEIEHDNKQHSKHHTGKSCLIHQPMGVVRTPQSEPSAASQSIYQHLRWLSQIERSPAFTWLCTAVISMNTFVLAYTAELGVKSGGKDNSLWAVVAEFSFCVFYTCELILRVVVFRAKFIWSDEWGWNLFDVVVVLSAWPDIILSGSGNQLEGHNLSYLRVLKVVKMLKLLRIIRLLSAFREFRLLMESILGSLKSIIWSAALVITLAFMFSVGFVQAHTTFLSSWQHTSLEDIDSDEAEILEAFGTYWNGLSVSMLSLYMSSTGGTDWEPVAMPLYHAGTVYYFAFLFYIAFFLFVIMNTVTSLFVDSIARAANKDDAQLIQDQLSSKDEFVEKIRALYAEMDTDASGEVTFDTFRKCLSDPRVLAFASCLDIEISDMQQFFNILSANGTRPVDGNTFVVGCIKLRGEARSVDVMDILITQRNALHEQEKFMSFCREKLEKLV